MNFDGEPLINGLVDTKPNVKDIYPRVPNLEFVKYRLLKSANIRHLDVWEKNVLGGFHVDLHRGLKEWQGAKFDNANPWGKQWWLYVYIYIYICRCRFG